MKPDYVTLYHDGAEYVSIEVDPSVTWDKKMKAWRKHWKAEKRKAHRMLLLDEYRVGYQEHYE